MFANAQQKKKLSNVYFLFKFSLKKLANNNNILTLTFSFKKKPQKVGLGTNGKLFFSFCFLIYQNKRTNCFFLLNKNIVRFGPSYLKKLKYFFVSLCFFCFRQQKNFSFFAFSQLASKKEETLF